MFDNRQVFSFIKAMLTSKKRKFAVLDSHRLQKSRCINCDDEPVGRVTGMYSSKAPLSECPASLSKCENLLKRGSEVLYRVCDSACEWVHGSYF